MLWGGGGELQISSDGADWRIVLGLKFSIPGFLWLVFHLRGDFCVFKTIGSCHSYVIDETEDVLGCPECCLSFVGNPRDFFWLGDLIFISIREMGWLCTHAQLHIGYSRSEGDSIGSMYEGTESWAKWTAPEKWNVRISRWIAFSFSVLNGSKRNEWKLWKTSLNIGKDFFSLTT